MSPSFLKTINTIGFYFNLILVSFILFFSVSNLYPYISGLAPLFAQSAVVFLSLSLIPGILLRFSLVSSLSIIYLPLKTLRRHIGIASFLFALGHALWVYLLPQSFAFSTNPSILWGSATLLVLTLLFITSNDYSQAFLSTNWTHLHQIIHLLIWGILIHVYLIGSGSWTLVLLAVALLDLCSWLVKFLSRPTTG